MHLDFNLNADVVTSGRRLRGLAVVGEKPSDEPLWAVTPSAIFS
jgi:hypothetical protein